MPKISVIVPIYGVEKYIARCAKSLFEQTLDDIEYLFINDCTLDKSIEILKKVLEDYPKRKPQVFIHNMEKNSGLPAARKRGVLNAKGDYILHCDSDDWVEPQMCKSMYEKAVEEEADIVVCDFYVSTDNDHTRHIGTRTKEKNQYLYNILNKKETWAIWNKLVHHSLYTNIIYPKHPMGEDFVLSTQLIKKSNKIDFVPHPLYHYFTNLESITRKKSKEHLMKLATEFCENVAITEDFFQNETDSRIVKGFIRYKNYARNKFIPLVNDKNVYKQWHNTFPEVNRHMLFSKAISFKEKMRYWGVRLRLLFFLK
jgi:glycosyltransferase involved in cell wall biosynthesis